MKKIALSLLISSCLLAPFAFANDYTLEDYQQIFQGDNQFKQQSAVESLVLSGLNDPSLFDIVEAKLNASLPLATQKHPIEYSSWLAKGLGYSGNEKYRASLQAIVNGDYHKKLRKYAQEGLDNLDKFAIWNPILNDKSQYDAKQPQQLNVLANALASSDLELKRMAAKHIADKRVYDEFLLEKLANQLTSLDLLKHDKLSIDTYAWIAKALASSANEKFKPVIVNIAETAPEKKLRKYATKYIKTYY
ncbi:hypothetical protein [Shewanella holmiensis]|uniref:HEAT repeat domain-containing protein n=1 Tax=Shewanella holmiensis TaxID=2952222 RepID=A0A9X3AU89_9GAMM|nr:hypothetical protein [Shewanella holmiensis]MCT7941285.1 hypothetical protein [Shewanella holmiensis]